MCKEEKTIHRDVLTCIFIINIKKENESSVLSIDTNKKEEYDRETFNLIFQESK